MPNHNLPPVSPLPPHVQSELKETYNVLLDGSPTNLDLPKDHVSVASVQNEKIYMLEEKLAQITVDYSDLSRVREENASLSEALKSHTHSLEQMKIQSVAQLEELGELKKQNALLEEELNQSKLVIASQIANVQLQIDTQANEALKSELEEVRKENAELHTKLTDVKEGKKTLADKLLTVTSKLSALQDLCMINDRNFALVQKELEDKDEQLKKQIEELEQLRLENEKMNKLLESRHEQLEQSKSNTMQLSQMVSDISEQFNAMQEDYKRIQNSEVNQIMDNLTSRFDKAKRLYDTSISVQKQPQQNMSSESALDRVFDLLKYRLISDSTSRSQLIADVKQKQVELYYAQRYQRHIVIERSPLCIPRKR